MHMAGGRRRKPRVSIRVRIFAKTLIRELGLSADANPQTYGTGIKEIWEVPEERGKEWLGRVVHTGGYPLGTDAYGGSFIYGISETQLALGFVVQSRP